ncbi:hypothetical protein PIB30_062910 [Stylosanthes scabra]|uniref:Uncharacterized protein n=1 Tax=Stylosanthes scabra TaxID=79078 RepID=A0ABU6SM40_9FABA|nr:hypothetical protein [Stylosanthes scabra]
MAVRGQLTRDPDINRLDRTHHVAGAIEFQDPQTLTACGVVPYMPPPDCLVETGNTQFPSVVGGVRDHVAGRGLPSRTPHGRRPDQRVCAGLSELVRDRDLGHGPGISGRSAPGRRGEELNWGEAELAEASSPDDSGGRRPAGCAAVVCTLLHHDDDWRHLVPRQDKQHRVVEARQLGDERLPTPYDLMDLLEIPPLLSTRQRPHGVSPCF